MLADKFNSDAHSIVNSIFKNNKYLETNLKMIDQQTKSIQDLFKINFHKDEKTRMNLIEMSNYIIPPVEIIKVEVEKKSEKIKSIDIGCQTIENKSE